MPFTPNRLDMRVQRVEFTFAGEKTFVSYRPATLNEKTQKDSARDQARMATLMAKEDPDEATLAEIATLEERFAALVARILVVWDYEESGADGAPNGIMVPLTPERVRQELAEHGDFVLANVGAAMNDYNQGNASAPSSPKR